MTVRISVIPADEFRRLDDTRIAKHQRLALTADMCRANTLASVKRAGSGHLGSSFSSLDIVTYLYHCELNVAGLGMEHPNRDVYFSSKGHDVPGFYSVLYALGILPEEQFLNLRRLGGTFGHPDVRTIGVEANSGSLGMGISKGKGMAHAKKLLGQGGRVFVMTGDGELQEGQIYEALQTAVHQKITDLHVIVDHNKVQSDKLVKEISDCRDLEAKFRAFGWHAARCDGHDFSQLEAVFQEFRRINDRPKVLIADTIKGRGVSFMEHPKALEEGRGMYRWHAGAPDDASFTRGFAEILTRINDRLGRFGLEPVRLRDVTSEAKAVSGVSSERVADAYGEALVEIMASRKDVVVLDADLAADCRIRTVEEQFPDRFIENGIAEQDMVSMAGGLALQGLLPVVNTFAAFLAARANEQIYNNACEKSRIIYVCHYSGLIPAGPGASHQSIRDISLVGALPDFVVLQPCNAVETKMVVDYCVNKAEENCVLRLVIGPSPRIIELPGDYELTVGRGVPLTDGTDAVLFAYGPVMLHEALVAAESLREKGFGLQVVHMPWLNRVDSQWLTDMVAPCRAVFILEDHAPVGGLGDFLLNGLVGLDLLNGRPFRKLAVEGRPACGTPQEVLRFHGLDADSLSWRICGAPGSPTRHIA